MVLRQAEVLLDSAEMALALDLEAFGANLDAWHEMAVTCRPLAGLETSVGRVRRQLAGSTLWQRGRARNLQDPMSFRCAPQVHGAAREALTYVRAIVETELNAVHSNPITVEAEDRVISLGNFDAVALSAAADFARIGLAPVIASASERTVKLLQAPISGLPAGLAEEPDLGDDALAELAVASQSFAVEAKMMAQPVSFESAGSSIAEGIEDRATMAPLSARRLENMVSFGARVVAVGLVVSAQAIDLRGATGMGAGTSATYAFVRRHVPFIGAGEGLPHPLDGLAEAVGNGDLLVSAARATT